MKRIVISPDNKKAIAFFTRLSEKKAELKQRIEEKLQLTVDAIRRHKKVERHRDAARNQN